MVEWQGRVNEAKQNIKGSVLKPERVEWMDDKNKMHNFHFETLMMKGETRLGTDFSKFMASNLEIVIERDQ